MAGGGGGGRSEPTERAAPRPNVSDATIFVGIIGFARSLGRSRRVAFAATCVPGEREKQVCALGGEIYALAPNAYVCVCESR